MAIATDHPLPGEHPRAVPRIRLGYGRLQENGFTELTPVGMSLVVTFRGAGMIDVFDAHGWWHVAFLDFDLQRKIHLDSAFGSPDIGLPFASALKREKGIELHRFDDLRGRHHYGFFVAEDYRNGGRKGLWNLDELMMGIALEYADTRHIDWFHIKPTGDTAPYYRRKYGAMCLPTTSTDKVASIPLGPNRQPLPHVQPVRADGQTRYLAVDASPDPAWPGNDWGSGLNS